MNYKRLILCFTSFLFFLLVLPRCRSKNPYPLSETGPYATGTLRIKLEDHDRNGRKLSLYLWYPAIAPDGVDHTEPITDASPNLNGAPYPLILMFSDTANQFASHLASHGFVVAGVTVFDSTEKWDRWLIDYPLDILFTLDQLDSDTPDGLEGVIDTDQAGAMGYSFDGYVSLALSGARIDPDHYLANCAQPPVEDPPRPEWWIPYMCEMTSQWNEIAAIAGDEIINNIDGLWQPMTDDRIQAVMPMAPEGAWWFGEHGLSTADRPILIIAGTVDDINPYIQEIVYIYQNLGTTDKIMISFVEKGHIEMITKLEIVTKLKHFATAFFGYHLQGREDYLDYFSEDFVSKQEGLAWGVYRSGE